MIRSIAVNIFIRYVRCNQKSNIKRAHTFLLNHSRFQTSDFMLNENNYCSFSLRCEVDILAGQKYFRQSLSSLTAFSIRRSIQNELYESSYDEKSCASFCETSVNLTRTFILIFCSNRCYEIERLLEERELKN